ncbi:MAG: protein kinase [Deltaproteobacteria bacterium]|nr:protein kinase [Deltaproteobacteria bacterium]
MTAPRQIGAVVKERYELVAQLSERPGGSSFRSFDTHDRTPVIVNFFSPDAIGDQEAVQLFMWEARGAMRLRHRHIVHLLDVGFDGDAVYAVSEFCEGDTLEHYLLPDRSLSVEETVSLMLPVLAGLAVAHRAGIVHRDIQPARFFLLPDRARRMVRLSGLGMGLAKHVLDLGGDGLERGRSERLGSESGSGSGAISPRSDVGADDPMSEFGALNEPEDFDPFGEVSVPPVGGRSRQASNAEDDAGVIENVDRELRGLGRRASGGYAAYVAPEQVGGAHDVNPATDVFAMGCVLYRCLAGRSPFVGDDVGNALKAVKRGEFEALEDVVPGLDSRVVEAVKRALSLQPALRFPDMGALHEALAPIIDAPPLESTDLESASRLISVRAHSWGGQRGDQDPRRLAGAQSGFDSRGSLDGGHKHEGPRSSDDLSDDADEVDDADDNGHESRGHRRDARGRGFGASERRTRAPASKLARWLRWGGSLLAVVVVIGGVAFGLFDERVEPIAKDLLARASSAVGISYGVQPPEPEPYRGPGFAGGPPLDPARAPEVVEAKRNASNARHKLRLRLDAYAEAHRRSEHLVELSQRTLDGLTQQNEIVAARTALRTAVDERRRSFARSSACREAVDGQRAQGDVLVVDAAKAWLAGDTQAAFTLYSRAARLLEELEGRCIRAAEAAAEHSPPTHEEPPTQTSEAEGEGGNAIQGAEAEAKAAVDRTPPTQRTTPERTTPERTTPERTTTQGSPAANRGDRPDSGPQVSTGERRPGDERAPSGVMQGGRRRDVTEAVPPDAPSEDAKRAAVAALQRGRQLRASGQLKGAEAAFSEAIEKQRAFVVAWNERGLLRRELHDASGAISDFTRAIDLAPQSAPLRLNRALARVEAKDLGGAIEDLDRVLALAPKTIEALILRGRIRADQGSHQDAIADFSAVLAIDEGHTEARLRRAAERVAAGLLAEALADYDDLIRRRPTDAAVFLRRGSLYVRMGRRAEAAQDLRRCLELDPKTKNRARIEATLQKLSR